MMGKIFCSQGRTGNTYAQLGDCPPPDIQRYFGHFLWRPFVSGIAGPEVPASHACQPIIVKLPCATAN